MLLGFVCVKYVFMVSLLFLSCLGLNFVQISSQIISCLGIVLIFDLHEQNQVLVMISVVRATCKGNRNNVLHYFQKSNMWWQNVSSRYNCTGWLGGKHQLTYSYFHSFRLGMMRNWPIFPYIVSNNNNFNSISGLMWTVSFFDWHETKWKICTNVLVMTSVELYTFI